MNIVTKGQAHRFSASMPDELCAVNSSLRNIMFQEILPVWSVAGVDHARGGYAETLNSQGQVPAGPRRIRVTARQIYAFSEAARLGWNSIAASACVRHGYRFLVRNTCADGFLFHSLSNEDMLLDRALNLYDQAFLLFSYAHAYELLGDPDILDRAHRLRTSLIARFGLPSGGFTDRLDQPFPLKANPHMHMLEAALAWIALDKSPSWRQLADQIVELLMTRLVDPITGAVMETFDRSWRPITENNHIRIEPGHNYEWAWLLLRWGSLTGGEPAEFPQRMITFAEEHGYDPGRHVALNEVWSNGTPCDRRARLWPQTERLKAWLAVAQNSSGDGQRTAVNSAQDAAKTLLSFLRCETPGLWHDMMLEDGAFVPGPAPASSLYHIICAIAELQRHVETNIPVKLAITPVMMQPEAFSDRHETIKLADVRPLTVSGPISAGSLANLELE